MNIEDIKVGEAYNVRVRVVSIGTKLIACLPLMQNGIPTKFGENFFKVREAEAFSPISPENGTKNTETAPKYDPTRKFRKGDKVKAVLRHGRIPNDGVPKDVILEVIADERDGVVKVLHKMGVILEIFNVYALYLELVTPIEELEPYYVKNIIRGYAVCKRGAGDLDASCVFWSKYHPNAKAAAEAERDRLNAEYRKEQ